MILAQRAPITGSYDYRALTRPGEPRVLRYRLKGADEPNTPSRWVAVPQEYAIGFAGNYRNGSGGIALGYGYGQDGTLDVAACESSLWSTGQNLRNNPAMRARLEPGGPLPVDGLQGSPASGHMGSVRIDAKPCMPAVSASGPPSGAGQAGGPLKQ
jgi:hypothetical protein